MASVAKLQQVKGTELSTKLTANIGKHWVVTRKSLLKLNKVVDNIKSEVGFEEGKPELDV